MRCADRFGVAEADVRRTGGELEAAEAAISTYDALSWGAGDGAIAMAVLMMLEGAWELVVELSRLDVLRDSAT